jgi:hypothetical protein
MKLKAKHATKKINGELIRRQKDEDAFRRLFAEVILRAFNDILTREWYQYYLIKWLKKRDKRAKRLLAKHHDAIDWLLYEKHELCFRVLKLEHLSPETIIAAISKKFNSPRKFNKLLQENPLE